MSLCRTERAADRAGSAEAQCRECQRRVRRSDGGEHGGADHEAVATAVHSQLGVDHRRARIVAHAARPHDVAGAERLLGMLDLGGLECLEEASMRLEAGVQAGTRVGPSPVAQLRTRYAQLVALLGQRHAVAWIWERLGEACEAQLTREPGLELVEARLSEPVLTGMGRRPHS